MKKKVSPILLAIALLNSFLFAEQENLIKGKAEKITLSSLTVVFRENNVVRAIPMIIHEKPKGILEGDRVEVKFIIKNKRRYLIDIKKIEQDKK